MKIIGAASLSVLVLASCIGDGPFVCETNSLGVIPASPSAQGRFLQIYTSNFYFSEGDKSNINQFTIDSNSNLDWIRQATVTIDGGTSDTPKTIFGLYQSNGTPNGQSLPIEVLMEPDVVQRYMSHSVNVKVGIMGMAPTQEVVLSNTMCVEKSL